MPEEHAPTGAHRLGPGLVGRRVVVRRVVPGEIGPSGGPAMTDVLGTMESWDAGRATIRDADGTLHAIVVADIVSGKPVPPRPSRLARFDAEGVERRAAGMFRPRIAEPLGQWTLRHTGGPRARPNSVLAVGDPGMPPEEALARVVGFYAAHGQQPCAQVMVGSAPQDLLEAHGWGRLRPDEADSEVHLAGVAALVRRTDPPDRGEVVQSPSASREWLVGNETALAAWDVVGPSLDLPDAAFLELREAGRQVARTRVNLVEGWACLADLTVQPDVRRQGWARRMMAASARWAAEQGASVMMLQVGGDNAAALALYDSLGFERHHAYRYYVAP